MADEEDLSYYRDQPDRLIEEFKKMKLAKKKAEHFAIEAKQSAQKVFYLVNFLLTCDNEYHSCHIIIHCVSDKQN